MKLNINIPSEMVDSKLNIQKTISTSILVLLSISSIVLFKTLELNNIVCSVGVSLGCIGAVLSFLQISKLQDFIYKPTGSKMVNTLYEFSFDKMEEVKKMIHKKEFSKLATENEEPQIVWLWHENTYSVFLR